MIYSFYGTEVPELSQVGGKAKALIETAQAGFPVPEGIVLSTDFFKPWLGLVRSLFQFRIAVDKTSKEACDALKNIVSTLPFNDAQQAELDKHFAQLKGETFAVRSSSPAEDLAGASFAGMYDTYLGVKREDVRKVISLAFASAFDYRVMAYKKAKGVNLDNVDMAVAIQRQLDPSSSGVAFSVNPLNNAFDEVLVNATFGLGVAVVSGIVTPDTYAYDVVAKKTVFTKVSQKEVSIALDKKGGLKKKENEYKEAPVLSGYQITDVAELAKKCEDLYGYPVDIEWAVENGALYLLQVRPITTHFPFFEELLTQPGDPKKIYIDISMLTQGFSEPMSTLGLELWSELVKRAKMGLLNPDVQGTAPALWGKQYVSVTALRKAIGEEFSEKFLDTYDGNIEKIFEYIDLEDKATFKQKEKPAGTSGLKWKFFKAGLSTLPNVIKANSGNYRSAIDSYLKDSSAAMDKARNLTAENDFKENYNEMLDLMSNLASSAPVLLAGMNSYKKLKNMFDDTDAEQDVVSMAMDLEGNPTSAMGHLLFDMASTEDFKNTPDRETFVSRVEARQYGDAFMALIDEFMEKYAVRGIKEIDIASARVADDTGLLFDELRAINLKDNQITTVEARREAAYASLLAVAQEKNFESKFVKEAKRYRATVGYREHPKYVFIYIIAMMRRVVLEMAEGWVAAGRLDNTEQVFDLHVDEIERAQKESDFDMREAVKNNTEGYKRCAHTHFWPLVIDSRGKTYKPELIIKNGDITGDPIAPGKATGRAKVLKTPFEKPVEPGEILVAEFTEPSWTPVFTNAAAVIMEIGGPLQHGGIIAREYGIPCVSGLMGITELIHDGDMIEVDGDNGVVRIIK